MSEGESPASDPAVAPPDAPAAGNGSVSRGGVRGAPAPFEVSQEPLSGEGSGEAIAWRVATPTAPAYEHLGELPATYGTQSVYLVAYDPKQLFAYWDLQPAAGLAYGLRVCRPDGEVETEVEIQPGEPGRYLPAAVPGGTYYVEMGASFRGTYWRPLAFSGRVTLPPSGLAGEAEPKFATLPFHLSFQRLLEVIHGAMTQGEELAAAISRLQRGDTQGDASLLNALANLSREQLQTLEKLLGQRIDLAAEVGTSFGGSESNLPAAGPRLGGSEEISSGALRTGLSSEGLSSGALRAGLSSESLSSGALRAGLGSESLTSGALRVGLSSESLTSGAASRGALWQRAVGPAGAMGSETLSSEVLRLASEVLFSRTLGSQRAAPLSSLETALSSFGWGAGIAISSRGGLRPGPSSEAWRIAAGGRGESSETLASGASFFHALEARVDSLSSMFHQAYESLSSDFGGSSSGGSGSSGGGSSSSPLSSRPG